MNLLRVPPEVELEGLDMAEFQQDFYPEFERQPEVIVLPTGEEVEAGPILLDDFQQLNGRQRPQDRHESRRRRVKGVSHDRQLSLRSLGSDHDGDVQATFWTFGPGRRRTPAAAI